MQRVEDRRESGTLLESALARPQQLYAYGDPAPDLVGLAATLAYGLARNHPFIDGNKRTAAVVCETFLMLNDVELFATDLERYPVFLALAEGKLAKQDFAAWPCTRVKVKHRHRVQEPTAKRYRTRG